MPMTMNTNPLTEFRKFPKIARLSRECIIMEKTASIPDSHEDARHDQADMVLCYLLDQLDRLGYRKVVDAWTKIPKHYS